MSREKKYVPGMGSIGAKLMILGEAPSYEETYSGKPFVGPSGRELDRLLKDAGINRSDCWLTNVCKYEVPPNIGKKKRAFRDRCSDVGIDLDEQLSELQVEINALRPNCILALGGTALWALSGNTTIRKYRGSIMRGMGHKFVPTYHPAHLLHTAKAGEIKGYWNRQVMIFDFKRAYEESTTPLITLPNRVLQIAQNSGQFWEFLDRYKDCDTVSVDIESGGHCLPICIGFAFTKSHGMTVPLWNEGGISTIPSSDLVTLWRMMAELLVAKKIIGQNFNYDRDKIRRLGFTINHLVSDTMMKAFTINPELPKNLAFNTSIYTREPFYKDEGMYEGSIKDLLTGCARDACVTKEIDEVMDKDLDELNLRKFYDNFIMKLPEFYLEIENTGFRIDDKKRLELLNKYVEWDERLNYEMFKLAGVMVNPASSDQVFELLFNHWKLPTRKGTGEEELTALLNLQKGVTVPEYRLWIEKCLESRRVRKTISTYLMAIPDFDGRMRTTCFPCLETGRSSTGQQEPPIRPKIDTVGKGRKNDMKNMGTPFQVFTKHGDIGADVRSMYIVDEGEIFVNADSSQAEARVVFNLATDEQALRDIDEHDYHALTASWFFGGSEDDYSKRKLGYESPIRFAGKTLRHAGHLGAGKRRAATELNTQARKYKIPISITESIAERALKIFHMKQPKIQGVFHAEVIDCLKNGRMLTAPLPWGIDAPCGGKRIFFERWGEDLFRIALSYIPQRAVTDNTKAAGIRIKKQFHECKIILEAHDALLFSVRREYLDDFIPIVKKEFERPINFSACSLPRRSLKIPCEVEIGENYMELKKYNPIIKTDKPVELIPVPQSVTEQFLANDVIRQDTALESIIYEHDQNKAI
jgi:uracil-DNA glycosylase family 4